MIGTIRKHSKAMWIVIIAVIIIVFVYWGNPASRNGDIAPGRDSNFGIMNGQVITPTIYAETAREVSLNYFYSSGGTWPGSGRALQGFNVEQETYQRLFLIQKMEEMGIHISDDAVAQSASARMRMVNKGNPVPVAEFEKQILAPQRLTFGDFERYIRHDLGIQQLVSVLGAGGDLVPPQEIDALYRRDFQELATQVVFFHANTNTAIAITPEKLGEFYTNRQAYYRLPDRVQVSYVSFSLSNFTAQAKQELDQVTNLTEIIEARYEQLGTNYFSDAKSPAEAKEKIRAEYLRQAAVNSAGKEAMKLVRVLDENKSPYTPEFFVASAKQLGFTPLVSAPFDRDGVPAGLDVNADFVKRAFNLTAEEPLAEPLVGDDHVYVIAFNRRLPSENPPFETIRERVTKDYRFVESALAAQRAGLDFHAAATNGLAAGKSFSDLCAQAKVKAITVAPFSQSTRTLPEVENSMDLQTFKRAAFDVAPGQVGQLLPISDGAAVVYVQAKLPIDETAMRTNLPAFTRSVHQVRRSEVFNEWFRREATKAFSTVPYFQQQQAQMSGAPAKK